MSAGIQSMLSRLRAVFNQSALDKDSADEFQAHLDMLEQRFINHGMPPEEARYAARRQFGGVTQISEDLRERRAIPQLQTILQDARYALRQLRKAPAFTTAAVATLALGIGANTAVFAVVNAVLLRPLPYADPGRIFEFRPIERHNGAVFPSSLSYPNFFDFRAQNKVFQHLVCFRDSGFPLAGDNGAAQLHGEIVSWDLFDLLGVHPQLGRAFLPEEERSGTHVVILSHPLWQSRFGGDKSIIGRRITLRGKLFTIVGVAPPGFHFPPQDREVELWTTLAEDAAASEYTALTEQRGARMLDVIGRPNPGVTVEQARAQMDSIAANLAKTFPDDDKNIQTTSIKPALAAMTGDTTPAMIVLLGAVGLVLLIACANIANLLLARSIEREREFAVRAAIGASRATVIRQLLTESLILAGFGCLAGVALGYACLRELLPLAGDSIPRLAETSIDGRVLAVSVALAVLTSILFSLAPAMQIAKTDLVSGLKDGTRGIARGRERLRRTLVVGQISIGLVLLSAASLLIASFLYLTRRDPGLRPDHVLTFNLSLPDQYTTPKSVAFSDQLLARLRALPGVQSAAAGFPLPFTGDQMSVSFDIKERPAPPPEWQHADIAIVTPGYFGTLGIQLLKGRDFSEQDVAKSMQVVIVNKAFAEKFFPGEEIIGKKIQSGATNGGKMVVQTIIGLVANAKQKALRLEPDAIYYFPFKQLSWTVGNMVLRTSVPPLSLESAARETVASIDEQAPVFEVRSMEDLTSTAIAKPRFQMLLFGSFAAIALLLTVVGLYGVLAYSVMKRTREIGVRIALGATHSTVLRMVLKEALLLVVVGNVIGIAAAFGAGHLLRKLVLGISTGNPLLLLIACSTLTLTSLIAAYLPAMRAASVDPLQALRLE